MEHDADWLKSFIAKRAQESWHNDQRPYYISSIANDVTKLGVNYKDLVAPLKLRQWAMTVDLPATKVITDPVHKAKVGFVPADQEFSFASDDQERGTLGTKASKKAPYSRPRHAILQFLETLDMLSDEELDEVRIPVKTIVRLLAR